MPTYEYKCRNCGNVFEVRQKFSDEPLTTHEACGGEVERLISAPALQFKGSGWYITDYAKGGSSGGNKPAASGDSGKTSGDSGKASGESSGGSNSSGSSSGSGTSSSSTSSSSSDSK